MIDRKARDELADLLLRYVRGEASEEDVEEFIIPLETDDTALAEVATRNIGLARDTTGSPDLSNPRVQRKIRMIERYVLFLRTDMEYQWGRTRFPLWTLALTPVVLGVLVLMLLLAFLIADPITAVLGRVGIRVDFSDVFLGGAVVLPVMFILLLERLLGVDGRYWPFYRRRDYLEAHSEQGNRGIHEGDSAHI